MMEKQQPPLNQSATDAASSQSAPAVERATISKFLFYCLEHHPFVFWSGVWTTMLIVAGVAVTGLMSPYFIEQAAVVPPPAPIEQEVSTPSAESAPAQQSASRPAPVVRQNRGQGNRQSNSSSVPLWSLGALVFSCAAGSLVISQRLKRSPAPSPTSAASPSRQPKRLTRQAKLRAAKSSQPKVAPVYPQPRVAFYVEPDPVMTVVPTVVPDEESHPLDWGGEPSLADMMDIRRRVFSSRL